MIDPFTLDAEKLMSFAEWSSLSPETRAKINAYGLEFEQLAYQLTAWQAEARAARSLLDGLAKIIEIKTFGDLVQFDEPLKSYLAARVQKELPCY